MFYYNYIKIEELEEFVKNYLVFCKFLDFKGCILVVEEGINGIVFGIVENMIVYMEVMKVDFWFVDMMFKIDLSEGYVFKKMFVRYCLEFVSLKLEEDIDLN